MNTPQEHSWMLINDGTGHFTDVSDLTGVRLIPKRRCPARNSSLCRIEGAQAADVNGDGRIDLYAASHLFLNQGNDVNGVPHFLDLGPRIAPSSFQVGTLPYYVCDITTPSPIGLPVLHDEGVKFFDFDNSGRLTLLIDGAESIEDGGDGVGVFTLDGLGNFIDHSDAIPHFYMSSSWGIQTADVDGDGLPDILLIGGCDAEAVFFDVPLDLRRLRRAGARAAICWSSGQPVRAARFLSGWCCADIGHLVGLARCRDFDLNGRWTLRLRSNLADPFMKLPPASTRSSSAS